MIPPLPPWRGDTKNTSFESALTKRSFDGAHSKKMIVRSDLMVFLIFDASKRLRYVSRSWPMARAALDKFVLEDSGCPRLKIYSDEFLISDLK